jgi:membrane protein YdbS with pleckstrin-like domain
MGPFADDWKRFRRIQWTLAALLLGVVPVMFLLAKVTHWLHSEWIDSVAIVVFFLTFIISMIRLHTFRCPRCRQCFSGDWLYNKSFLAAECVHYGLPKLSDDGN